MEDLHHGEEFEPVPGLSRRVRRIADSCSLLMVSFTVFFIVINTVHHEKAHLWVFTVITGFFAGGCVVLSFVVRCLHRHLLEAAPYLAVAVACDESRSSRPLE
ncbi:hypothetical protein OG943_09070 [Amycolatopsis sp. NBC_00345]|uniref:hypothetical protein n=1 Tax=Amycolatopsis sp. NBC_00345 TaxID=2975955 RepID=UPI002E25FE2D